MAKSRSRRSSNGLAFAKKVKRSSSRKKKARQKTKKLIRRGNAAAVTAVRKSLKLARKALSKLKKRR
jgi:hypothetical protein